MGMEAAAECVTGMLAPLPTVMEGEKGRARREWRLPGAEAMCVEAPVSRYQPEELAPLGGTPALARAARSVFVSQVVVAGDGVGFCRFRPA